MKSKSFRQVEWVVDYGYAGGGSLVFSNEDEARRAYDRVKDVPSYINPDVCQPALLTKRTTTHTLLEKNR